MEAVKDSMLVTMIDGKPSLAMMVKVMLKKSHGHIYERDGTLPIMMTGYKYLNRYAKITIIKPPYQLNDGKKVENPYFIRDEKKNTVAVQMRGTGVAKVIGGGIVMLDQTVYYDLKSVLLNKLMATIKYNPTAGVLVDGKYDALPEKFNVLRKGKADDSETQQVYTSNGNWGYIEIDPLLGGLYYNRLHPEVDGVLRQHVAIMSTLSTRMNTNLERQIYRSHPAIGVGVANYVSRDARDVVGEVNLWTWRQGLTPEQIANIRTLLDKGENFVDSIEIGKEKIESVLTSAHSVNTVDEDESQEEQQGEYREEGREPDLEEERERERLMEVLQSPPYVSMLNMYLKKPLYKMSADDLKALLQTLEERV